MSLNTCIVSGNLVSDPKPRKVKDYQVVSFAIAVNEGYGDKQRTSFINCEAWGKTGDTIVNNLKKGSPVGLVGRLQQDRWEKDGKKESMTKIVVEKVEFLGGKSKDNTVKDNNFDGGEINLAEIPF